MSKELREALARAVAFMDSIKLVPAEDFDAHGMKWPSSRWSFDIKEQIAAVKAGRAALALPLAPKVPAK